MHPCWSHLVSRPVNDVESKKRRLPKKPPGFTEETSSDAAHRTAPKNYHAHGAEWMIVSGLCVCEYATQDFNLQ